MPGSASIMKSGRKWRKIGHRIARMARPVGRRVDHAVAGRAQHAVGQPLQHVADVDHQLARLGADRDPAAVLGLQLQPRFLGAEQQGDGVDVLMRAGADMAAGRLGLRRIVEQAHDRIAVADRVGEIFLVDLQEARDGAQHLHARRVERVVKLEEGLLEAGDFVRPDIVGHHLAELVARRQLAADVPEFLEVERLRALGGLDPERAYSRARRRRRGSDISSSPRRATRRIASTIARRGRSDPAECHGRGRWRSHIRRSCCQAPARSPAGPCPRRAARRKRYGRW